MYMNVVLALLLALFVGGAVEYEAHQSHDNYEAEVSEFSENARLLGQYVSHYAAANQQASGPVADSSLSLPKGFTPDPELRAYVNDGSAYVYLPLGSAIAPSKGLSYLGGPEVKAGLKSGGQLMYGSGTPVVVNQSIPGGIPDGAMVYVSRDVLPVSSNGMTEIGPVSQPLFPGATAPLAGPVSWTTGQSVATSYQVTTPTATMQSPPAGYDPNGAGQGGGGAAPTTKADFSSVKSYCTMYGNVQKSQQYTLDYYNNDRTLSCNQGGLLVRSLGTTLYYDFDFYLVVPSDDYTVSWSGDCTPDSSSNDTHCATDQRVPSVNNEQTASATATVTYGPTKETATFNISYDVSFCGSATLNSSGLHGQCR